MDKSVTGGAYRLRAVLAGVLIGLGAWPASGGPIEVVDLVLVPSDQTVAFHAVVNIELRAIADDVPLSGAEVIFGWDPAKLMFLGVDNTGAAPLLLSAISPAPPDAFFGINEADPPQDGDALYTAAALPLINAPAAPGVLLTTLQFQAIQATAGTNVLVFDSLTKPNKKQAVTEVFGSTPGLNIWSGAPAFANVAILPEPATALLWVGGAILSMRRRRRARSA